MQTFLGQFRSQDFTFQPIPSPMDIRSKPKSECGVRTQLYSPVMYLKDTIVTQFNEFYVKEQIQSYFTYQPTIPTGMNQSSIPNRRLTVKCPPDTVSRTSNQTIERVEQVPMTRGRAYNCIVRVPYGTLCIISQSCI